MSNSTLNTTDTGRTTIRDSFAFLSQWAKGRRLRRRFFRFYRDWFYGDHAAINSPSFAAMVSELNSAHDIDETQFRAIGARFGASPESYQDENYYVDPVNGSDITGNGTVDYPFESLWFLPYFLPKRIDHHYRIILVGDVTLETIQIDQEFGPFGSIAFIGQGAAVIGDNRLVDAGSTTYEGLEHFPMTVGGLSDDQYTNWFLMSNANDEAHPIFYHNAAGEFKTLQGWVVPPVETDAVSFVRPKTTLTVAGISIGGSTPKMRYTDSDLIFGSRIGFFNLNIDVRNTIKTPSINLESLSGIAMSFVRVIHDDNVPTPMKMRNTELNESHHIDPDIELYAQSGIANICKGLIPTARSTAGITFHNADGFEGNNDVLSLIGQVFIRDVSVRQAVTVSSGLAQVTNAACNSFQIVDGTLTCTRVGIGYYAETPSVELHNARFNMRYVSFFAWGLAGSTNGIIITGALVSQPGFAELSGYHIDLADTPTGWSGFGVSMYCPTKCFFRSSPTLLVGTAGAYSFQTVAPARTGALWPAAGLADADLIDPAGLKIQSSIVSVHA